MKRFLISLLLWLGMPCLVWAQLPDHPLTLPEVLDLLHQRNPALAAGRAHLDATRANEITAALRPNPVFNTANEDFNPLKLNTFNLANTQEFTNSFSWLIERGGKRKQRIGSAVAGTAVARNQYQDSVRQADFQAKQAFVNMLLAKTNLQFAQQNLADYKKNVEANELRLKAGDISATDFDRIRLQQAQFETDALNAQLALDQARVQLESLIGLESLPLNFDIQGTLDLPVLGLSYSELQQDALAHRPDYLAARDSVHKAEADYKLAVANGATDFNIAPEFKRNGPDNTVGLSFNIPLRIFDRNQGEKLRTSQEIQASRFTENAARLQVLSDLKQGWDAYNAAYTRSQLYSTNYLKMARSVRDNVEFSYRNGGTSLLDYLDALRSYRDVELAAHSANAQLLNAIHQLSFVTATELLK